MARIFASLALGNIVVLLLAAALGAAGADHAAQRHVLLAVFALMVSCFVQVAAVTYMSVTSRLLSQAVHLGGLDAEPLERVRKHKRSIMHAVGLVFMAMVLMTATGATNWRSGGSFGDWHFGAACLGFVIHLLALYRQHGHIVANSKLVGEVLGTYSETAFFGGPRGTRTVKSRDITADEDQPHAP